MEEITTQTLPSVSIHQLPMGSMDAYIQKVNEIPLLTQEEEFALATQYQKHGDLEAAQKLVLAHLRYVVRVARGYLGYGLPLNDLVQEGTIGLMKAVKRFDPDVGVRLVSFAVHWIKSEMHEFILRHWRVVKVATTKAQRKLFFNLRSATKRLGWNTQEEINTIADELGVPAKEVLRMEERLNARDVAFDLPVDHHEQESGSRALVPAEYLEDHQSDPSYSLEAEGWTEYTQQAFQEALSKLDERSRTIIEQRWLSGHDVATLQTLAEQFSISPERVRQIEKSAIEKLKQTILTLQDS